MKVLNGLWRVVVFGGLVASMACSRGIWGDQPEQPQAARVDSSLISVEKEMLGRAVDIGVIHEIQVQVGENGEQELALSGELGALTMNSHGVLSGKVIFMQEDCPPISLVRRGDLDGDGSSEWVWTSLRCGVVAVDSNGELLWWYAEQGPLLSFVVADLDGDGADEIVAHALMEQNLLWFNHSEEPTRTVTEEKSIPVWISIADMDADGVDEIVYGVVTDLVIRDPSGTELLRTDREEILEEGSLMPLMFARDLQLVPWPPGSENLSATSCTVPNVMMSFSTTTEASMDAVTVLVSRDGKLVVKLDSPMCGSDGGPGGRSVLGADGIPYMTMVTNHDEFANLFVWSADAKLVYHEIVEVPCNDLEVLQESGGDRLLLGCGDTVWAYRLGTGQPADLSTPAASP